MMCETARLPTALRMVSFTAARGAIIGKLAPQWSLLGLEEASCCCSLWSSSQTLPAESSPSSGRTENIVGNSFGCSLVVGLNCKDTIPEIRNKYSQGRNCAATVPIPAFMFLWAIYVFPLSVCLFCCRKIGGPNVGICRSLTDTWVWKLGRRSRNSLSGNT